MPDTGDLIWNPLPNGTGAFYRDRDHSYWREAQKKKDDWAGKGRLTGISTVAGPFDFRPDNLMQWAAKLNGEGVSILAADGLSQEDADEIRTALQFLESADTIWEALCDAELTYEHIRDQAAVRGTNVHKHGLHALATGEPVPDFAALTDEERAYVRGVVGFWHECEPEPLHAEQVVADLDLGVAGRLDLRAVLGAGEHAGKTALVDAKTTGYISNKDHVQIAGYEHCSRVSGLGASDVQLILQVNDQGGYDLIPIEATAGDFELAVKVYRRAGKIGNAAGKRRKEQREAVTA